jgi:thioredoxin-like negative regulator of GroEL
MQQAYANSGDSGVLFTLAVQLINAGDYTQALEYIDKAIADVTASNNIRTGTRRSKLETLGSMREDVLGFMAGTQ